LISPTFNYEVVKLVSEHFKLKIRNLAIAELPKLKPNWFTVLGAGLRGLISRSRDTDITLSETKAQDEYYFERGLHFLSLWRNIIIGVFVFLLISFSTAATVLNQEEQKITDKIAAEFSLEDAASQILAQDEIDKFNNLLEVVGSSLANEKKWSEFFETTSSIGGDSISITRIAVRNMDSPIDLKAFADSEEDAVAFKKRLSLNPEFHSVVLPLSNNLTPEKNGVVSFFLTFKLAGADEDGAETEADED